MSDVSNSRLADDPRGARGRSTAVLLAATALLAACAWLASSANAAPQLSFTEFSSRALTATGAPSTQAGGHPYELVTTLKTGEVFDPVLGIEVPDGTLKDTTVELPAGVLGNPRAVPQCSQQTMDGGGALPFLGVACAIDTQVGVAEVEVGFIFHRNTQLEPIYNLVPPPGEPAQFGFLVSSAIVHVDTSVRTGADYGATATAHNLNAAAPVYFTRIHLWGVPADPAHNAQRFLEFAETGGFRQTGAAASLPAKPFLRNSTACTGPLTSTLRATAWQEPEEVVSETSTTPANTGCGEVPFAPKLTLTPDSKRAGSPAGFGVDIDLPQNEHPEGLATADLRRAVVTMPAGAAINPSAGDGLVACSDAELDARSAAAGNCPTASKIGTMTVTTPLLQEPLHGSVFLGTPLEQSPAAAAAGRMFRLFLEAEGSGVRVKLAGSLVPDPVTGQLIATFDNNPQLPFTNVHLAFQGGEHAPLTLPKACGTYTTHSEFTSWASETPVSSDSSFALDQNCDQAGKFEPSLEAGLINPAAGAFSPFTLTLSRPDGQQDVSGLDVTLPPGLVAKLASVPLCPEAQAVSGTCPSASQIGRTTIASGAGTSPLYVPQAGKTPTAVYVSGPYRGAPFSLSVVVPAEAGPFDLGTVVVRAALFVDRHDGHVSVQSDPIPTILDGVPLNVQKINVTVDRPGFMIAPTNCNQMQFSGTAGSSGGATASLASRFQVGGCTSLKFAPKFSAGVVGVPSNATSASARRAGAPRASEANVVASKANGVSLHVKLAYPNGSLGTQANIAKVKVELPKQLPSRLTTLQKACPDTQFAANPAGCPAESVVGTAKVITPILPVPLVGPAYFVSHGGEAFPNLTMVLQGDGVTVELVGTTFISKTGITSTTFNTVPDVPFNTFELDLPQGRFSALTGNGDLCKPKLVMPTDYVAQNGVQLHQSNPIVVSGCAKAQAPTRAQKLAAALKACKKKPKGTRAACQRQARKRYGAISGRKAGKRK